MEALYPLKINRKKTREITRKINQKGPRHPIMRIGPGMNDRNPTVGIGPGITNDRNQTVGIGPRIVDRNLIVGPGSGISEVGVEAPITSPGKAVIDLEAVTGVPMIGMMNDE